MLVGADVLEERLLLTLRVRNLRHVQRLQNARERSGRRLHINELRLLVRVIGVVHKRRHGHMGVGSIFCDGST